MPSWFKWGAAFVIIPSAIGWLWAAIWKVIPFLVVLWLLIFMFTGENVDKKNYMEIVSVNHIHTGSRYDRARLVVINPSEVSYWKYWVTCDNEASTTTYTDLDGMAPYSVKEVHYRVDGEAGASKCSIDALHGRTGTTANGPSSVEVVSSEYIGKVEPPSEEK